jgi:hypothetical protein
LSTVGFLGGGILCRAVLDASFFGCFCLEDKSVQTSGKLVGESAIDQAVSLDLSLQ